MLLEIHVAAMWPKSLELPRYIHTYIHILHTLLARPPGAFLIQWYDKIKNTEKLNKIHQMHLLNVKVLTEWMDLHNKYYSLTTVFQKQVYLLFQLQNFSSKRNNVYGPTCIISLVLIRGQHNIILYVVCCML